MRRPNQLPSPGAHSHPAPKPLPSPGAHAHPLSHGAQHLGFVNGDVISEVLLQNDLYARIALNELPKHEQQDLLCWAEAHQVL